MEMPGRSYEAGDYRFGFNGKEDDPEAVAAGSQYDYGFRIYNTGIGRFLSVDPLTADYPMLTPFQYASNNPIMNIDIDGLEGAAATMPAGRKWSNSGLPTGTTSAVSTATVYIPKPKLLPTLAPVNIPQSNGTLHRGLSNYERFLNTAVPPMGDPIGTAIRTDPVLSSVSVGGALLMATTVAAPLVASATGTAANSAVQSSVWLTTTTTGALTQLATGAAYSLATSNLTPVPQPDIPNTGGLLPLFDFGSTFTDLAMNSLKVIASTQQSYVSNSSASSLPPAVSSTGRSTGAPSGNTSVAQSDSPQSNQGSTSGNRKGSSSKKSSQSSNTATESSAGQTPIGINTVKFKCN
jgi:RHS repeat-associated protein